jgi:cystathionine gamma-synthase
MRGRRLLGFLVSMAAISTAFISNVGKGDVIVTSKEIYGASLILLRNLEKFGIRVKSVMNDGLAEAIDSKTKLVFVESITNPTLKIPDIEGLIGLCREQGATFIIDNTFASPVNFKPISVGADYVIHSATKYLRGHTMQRQACLQAVAAHQCAWEWRRTWDAARSFAHTQVIRGSRPQARVEMHNKNGWKQQNTWRGTRNFEGSLPGT